MATTSPPRSAQSKHGGRARVTAAQHAVGNAISAAMFSNTQFGDDLLQARWDMEFFSERFLGIKPHPGQKRIWRTIMLRDDSGWRPRYIDIDVAAGNRAGKTLGVSVPLLHNVTFKIGKEPPNPMDEVAIERWAAAPFEAYHFGIAQEIAELAYIEITRMLLGLHEAQPNGCPITKELGQPYVDWSRKYRGEYLWMVVDPAFGGGNIHFRTTGERAIGSLGKDMDLISYDEAGFDPHFEFIWEEVLNLRRLSTGGQIWCIGTSTEGITSFSDHWERGNPDAPDKHTDAMSLRMSTRENIGYGIDQAMFDRVVAGMDPDLIPQNIDGYFIQGRHSFFSARSVDNCFVADMPETVPQVRGGEYISVTDPALTFDAAWNLVLKSNRDGVATGVHVQKSRGRQTGLSIAAMAENSHRAYSGAYAKCISGIDATGFGGKMFRDLLSIKPLHSIEFGGTKTKKLKMLNDLKWCIENGKIRMPRTGAWLDVRRQLLGYRLDDKNIEQDAVMCLAMWAYLYRKNPSGGSEAMPFDYFHQPEGGVISVQQQAPGLPRRLRLASYTSLSEMRDE